GPGITLTLQAEDAYGNAETTGISTESITVGSGADGTFSVIVNQGNGTYTATFTTTTAGTRVFAATLNDQTLTSPAPSLDVLPGAADPAASRVSVSPNSATLGAAVTVALQVRDKYGNNLTTGGAAVAFQSNGTGTLGAVSYAGNGLYTATYTPGALGV